VRPVTRHAVDLANVARLTARAQRLIDDVTEIQPLLARLSAASLESAEWATDTIRDGLDPLAQPTGGLLSIVTALHDVVSEMQVAR